MEGGKKKMIARLTPRPHLEAKPRARCRLAALDVVEAFAVVGDSDRQKIEAHTHTRYILTLQTLPSYAIRQIRQIHQILQMLRLGQTIKKLGGVELQRRQMGQYRDPNDVPLS